MTDEARAPAPRVQIVLAGIGGQGVLFATRILGEAALRQGLAVIGSETHGMSQRGGSVVSHLKVGGCRSPLVRTGNADALIGLEPHEAYRALRLLRPARLPDQRGGMLFVNDPGGLLWSDSAVLERAGVGIGVVDATALARELGSPVVVNLVVLGFASAHARFAFDLEQLDTTVAALSPPRFAPLNRRALAQGHRLGLASRQASED